MSTPVMRFNVIGNCLINPEPNGMYVRHEDYAELEATLAATKRAALAGMDAAKSASLILYEEAARLRAESSPDVLASERAANAMLTEENERLSARLATLEAQFNRESKVLP